jgi:uncharacterized protein (DUF433 family)
MRQFDAISVYPEIQNGAPVFSGTRIPIETFCDYLRIGVSMNEFLDEFPSITRDQVQEVYELVSQQYTPDQIKRLVEGPETYKQQGIGRGYSASY